MGCSESCNPRKKHFQAVFLANSRIKQRRIQNSFTFTFLTVLPRCEGLLPVSADLVDLTRNKGTQSARNYATKNATMADLFKVLL